MDELLPLPSGDTIHFDGHKLSVDGVDLEPGRHAIGTTQAVLEVYPDVDDVDELTED